MRHPEITAKIEELTALWWETDASRRVGEIESFAMAHGTSGYGGVTIPEVIKTILNLYTDFLIQNPLLLGLGSQGIEAEILKKNIDAEKKKLKEALELKKLLDSYFLGVLDPRYWKTKKQLKRVTDNFMKYE